MSRPAFFECPDSRALEPTEVGLGRWMPAQKPATGCGVYGASNWATSSWVSTISSDAIASSRCAGFRAPVIGAETTGLRDTHARAICARDTPRVAAIDATAATRGVSRAQIALAW